ncbi:hypothetical protein LZU85_04510 [Vibrio sp. IRLE0018]|uniref:hypothetical protein n=1 Tax=Vibrio TaxID=662 RepID=UPI0015948FBC|nr:MULTISPECIES: hypothetical protein [Vibrio]MCF8778053.1 hypothetical protein [Vibrio floridensis]NVC63656.1 hypothetical protein [Vibrio sp. 05-20-BW147]HAS6348306.1 hypothetical protein [Vibrio vulnificus]
MNDLTKAVTWGAVSLGLLAGCGGGEGGSSSTPSTPVVQTQFSDIKPPTGFEWRSSENRQLTIKIVSNYTFQQGEAVAIRGQHVVRLFSVVDDVEDSVAMFTGLTGVSGELTSRIDLAGHWQAIKAVSNVREVECVSHTDVAAIVDEITVGCDIALDSD